MSLKCGIVGLPNVGKSTLFNALTKSGIAAENYPFCTIEPNVGIVEVPDPRMDELAKIVKPQRMQYAIVEFVDIAGLVAGASKGEGLATSSLPTSARPTPSSTSCAASMMKMSCTSRARSIRFQTSKSSSPNWRWPIWLWWNAPSSVMARKPNPATRTRRNWSPCWRNCCRT